MRIAKKIFILICCYITILWGLLFVKELGLSQFAIGFQSLFTGVFVVIFSKNTSDFWFYGINQSIGFIGSFLMTAIIYAGFYSSDFITNIGLFVITAVGIVLYVAQFWIEFALVKLIKKKRNS